MATKKKAKTKPQDEFDAQGVVENAIAGMTKRLERGDKPFSEYECRLFVALIQIQNNRNLMSDTDLLEAWGERFGKIEAWINSRQSAEAIQAAARPKRRQPQPQQFGPGAGFDGNAQR